MPFYGNIQTPPAGIEKVCMGHLVEVSPEQIASSFKQNLAQGMSPEIALGRMLGNFGSVTEVIHALRDPSAKNAKDLAETITLSEKKLPAKLRGDSQHTAQEKIAAMLDNGLRAVKINVPEHFAEIKGMELESSLLALANPTQAGVASAMSAHAAVVEAELHRPHLRAIQKVVPCGQGPQF